jgi:hypothetical protein
MLCHREEKKKPLRSYVGTFEGKTAKDKIEKKKKVIKGNCKG